jgi:hypothetical protein
MFLATDGRRLDRQRCRADRPLRRTPGRDRQGRHAPYAQARLHHRRPGCRSAIAGRARGRLARGPENNDVVTGPVAAWTGMRPTSFPPTWQALPGNGARRPGAACDRRRHPLPRGDAQRPQREGEPPIRRGSWVGWLTVSAEPKRAFCYVARAIFAQGRDLRLGDQRCVRSLAACLCHLAFRVRCLLALVRRRRCEKS